MFKEDSLNSQLRNLNYFAEILVEKSVLKKIHSIDDLEERKRLYIYIIQARLELRYAELKETLLKFERLNKDVFVAKTKLSLLKSKIGFFNATHRKDDFKKIEDLFREVKKEVKNV